MRSEQDRASDKWRGREEIAARDHWHAHASGHPISESWLDGWLSCAKARAAHSEPVSAAAVRVACASVPALEEARHRRLKWADEAHAQILAVTVPAQPASAAPASAAAVVREAKEVPHGQG